MAESNASNLTSSLVITTHFEPETIVPITEDWAKAFVSAHRYGEYGYSYGGDLPHAYEIQAHMDRHAPDMSLANRKTVVQRLVAETYAGTISYPIEKIVVRDCPGEAGDYTIFDEEAQGGNEEFAFMDGF